MRKFLLLTLLVAGLSSCKKDVPETRREMFSQPWAPTLVLFNGQVDNNVYYNTISWEFFQKGTYVFYDSNGTTEGNWEFTDDAETNVTLDKGTEFEVDWKILLLDAQNMRIKYTDSTDVIEIAFKVN